MCSVGPPLPETIGLPKGMALCILVSELRYSWWILALTRPLVSHFVNMPVLKKSVYFIIVIIINNYVIIIYN